MGLDLWPAMELHQSHLVCYRQPWVQLSGGPGQVTAVVGICFALWELGLEALWLNVLDVWGFAAVKGEQVIGSSDVVGIPG